MGRGVNFVRGLRELKLIETKFCAIFATLPHLSAPSGIFQLLSLSFSTLEQLSAPLSTLQHLSASLGPFLEPSTTFRTS